MPRINLFDQVVDKITNECNISEDWGLIMEVCDKVKTANGSKDCIHAITKRLNHLDPHVVLFTLTLLDACVKNCGRTFHLEVCSRSFVDVLKKLYLNKKSHPKVIERLRILIRRWSEEDFANDPQLSLMTALYNLLRKDFINFIDEENKSPSLVTRCPSLGRINQDDDDDMTMAIKLSLKETNPSSKSVNSLYPTVSSPSMHQNLVKEPRKVRALYDFEAAEDNELTFKAGEVVLVLDDNDANWWKGSNHRGEGLFPSNFVTADLTVEPGFISEDINVKSSESNNESVSMENNQKVMIDEEIIDKVLHSLHEADPTSDQSESDDLKSLQEYCMAMGPLIDQELEKIDRKHASLTAVSHQLTDALNYYHALMKDCGPPFNPNLTAATGPFPYVQQPHYDRCYPPDYIQQAPPPNMMPQQYLHTGVAAQSVISQPQNQVGTSGSFMNAHPIVNSNDKNVYSVTPPTTTYQ